MLTRKKKNTIIISDNVQRSKLMVMKFKETAALTVSCPSLLGPLSLLLLKQDSINPQYNNLKEIGIN